VKCCFKGEILRSSEGLWHHQLGHSLAYRWQKAKLQFKVLPVSLPFKF